VLYLMKERKERLKEVYEYLRRYKNIHTQTDFASAINYSRNAITLAMNGNGSYLTDRLFENICKTFPGVFSLDYLLTGRGVLLMERPHSPQTTENVRPTADMVELYAQRIRLVDDLRASLREELNEVKAVRADLQQTVTRLNRAIRELNKKSGTKAAEK